jgi:hypothetical protein
MPFNSPEFYKIFDLIVDILVIWCLISTDIENRKLKQRLDQMEVQVSASVQSESVGPDSAANPI